jgi:hypothetical protein
LFCLFAFKPQPIDNLLKNCLGKFLNAIQDNDINVRRVALVTFNSAAHNKPSLVRDLLLPSAKTNGGAIEDESMMSTDQQQQSTTPNSLIQYLYNETKVKRFTKIILFQQ